MSTASAPRPVLDILGKRNLELGPFAFEEAHGDAGDVKIETKKDSGTLSEAKATTAARAMYPFEYLENMTKACPDDAVLGIWLKSDAPVKLGYEIGSAKLMYYLAPRVENG